MRDGVGPVLDKSAEGEAVVAAIRERNEGVEIRDRGSYWRVLVPERCIVECDAVERFLGRPFALPGDLEGAMPSFKGELAIHPLGASWTLRRRP